MHNKKCLPCYRYLIGVLVPIPAIKPLLHTEMSSPPPLPYWCPRAYPSDKIFTSNWKRESLRNRMESNITIHDYIIDLQNKLRRYFKYNSHRQPSRYFNSINQIFKSKPLNYKVYTCTFIQIIYNNIIYLK